MLFLYQIVGVDIDRYIDGWVDGLMDGWMDWLIDWLIDWYVFKKHILFTHIPWRAETDVNQKAIKDFVDDGVTV